MGKAILFQFLFWYVFDVPKEILKGWRNYLIFYLNYFSVITLVKTYFSHWHRYHFSYGKGWNPTRYFEALTGNIMSRVIGMILRTFLIIFGIFSEIIILFLGALVLAGWYLLPFFLLIMFFTGIGLLV